jgi:hypothetical protein
MGKDFHNNPGRAVSYDLARGGLQDEHVNDVSGDLYEGANLGVHRANWGSIVITASFMAMHQQSNHWRNLSREQKDEINAAKRAERAHRNRYDRRQHSINAASLAHQKKGCNVILAYDRAIETRFALDYERFNVMARKYQAFCSAVSLDAVNKRVKKDPTLQTVYETVLTQDAHTIDAVFEYPMRYGSTRDHLIEQMDSRHCLEPLAEIKRCKRSDELRRHWIINHVDAFVDNGDLWPKGCIWQDEETKKKVEQVAAILAQAGIELEPEHPQVWGC